MYILNIVNEKLMFPRTLFCLFPPNFTKQQNNGIIEDNSSNTLGLDIKHHKILALLVNNVTQMNNNYTWEQLTLSYTFEN